MTSGVKVHDDVKKIFNDMKVHKCDAVHEDRIRVAIFGIKDGFIEVDKYYTERDLEGKDVFMFFKSLLLPNKCFYILYDCHYETKESCKKEDLVLGTWCPDCAPIKDKMHYSSSKGALKSAFKGIKHDWQLNDLCDINDRPCFADKLGGKICKVEGCDVMSG